MYATREKRWPTLEYPALCWGTAALCPSHPPPRSSRSLTVHVWVFTLRIG